MTVKGSSPSVSDPSVRKSLEQRLATVTRELHELSQLKTQLKTQLERAEKTNQEKMAERSRLKIELEGLEKTPPPVVRPSCWCCSCVYQDPDNGCSACLFSDAVQAWIDIGTPSSTATGVHHMTADHDTGFGCPEPEASQCPGWQPKEVRKVP